MVAPEELHIDFDEWSQLAQDNPEAFEQRRLAVIASTIASAPHCRRQRLQGLQWRIDQTRRRASSPMGACVAISRMMMDAVYGDNGLRDSLTSLTNDEPPPAPRRNARILPFRPTQH